MSYLDIACRCRVYRRTLAPIAIILISFLLATWAGWLAPFATEAEPAQPGLALQVAHAWAVIPFLLLLAAIAVLPMLKIPGRWWEHNLSKFYVAIVLALLTLMYLIFFHPAGSVGRAVATLEHVVIRDYIPFMVLLFSLYTIAGGIRIEGDLPAHAATNTMFMGVSRLLASFIGTTGAAMLLIRPLLQTNAERKHVKHTVVFFIFVVCNCGGLLLPLGDPPLFLGYLNGVDFFWTLTLWKSWLFVNGLLLAGYFLIDHFYYYPRESEADIRRDETQVRKLTFLGLWPNALFLLGIVLSVALLDPGKTFPGTEWHPWFYLREMVQLALVGLSLLTGPHTVREANDFDYLAIVEVGALFIGIFITMQPALEILHARGATIGLDSPQAFFWASGWLSAVLDNAPTYLVFFKTAQAISAQRGMGETVVLVAGVAEPLLKGIALGSVTMGAMTYIGNGPNFMVKAIAERAGVRMPGFIGFTAYGFAILLPILLLNAWLFL